MDITINIDYHETGEHFHEAFSEYSYALDTVCALLEKYGFAVAKVADGESFGPVRGDSPRWIITAVKQYTQEEKELFENYIQQQINKIKDIPNKDESFLKHKILEMYSNPLKNKLIAIGDF